MILRLAPNRSCLSFIKRTMSNSKALVIGINLKQSKEDDKRKDIELSSCAKELNEKSNGALLKAINSAFCDKLSSGKARLLFDANVEDYCAIAVTALDTTKWDNLDGINADHEAVRIAASSGVKALQSLKLNDIYVDDLGCGKSAAEGSILASFKFQPYKSKKTDIPTIHAVKECDGWKKGAILANAQNFCKVLMDTPANLMTPTLFCEMVKEKFNGLANVDIQVHDAEWAKKEKMNLYLSVTSGSSEPPKFLEITYTGDSSSPQDLAALVGKGITFDSGGISLKPSSKMDQMRGDMGGAANVVSTLWAIASLKVPINVKAFTPLCENMPGNYATKPGDVFFGRNGKSVCIDNTDAEGRLILADALSYASDFKPRFILDVATLTGAVRVALGDCVTAIFSNSDPLWESIQSAGKETGDRVWRMPLYSHYTSQLTDHDAYDLNNLGKGKGAGSCVAAAFLREFVPKNTPWMHADIAGVMCETSDQSYVGTGSAMTGRPVRTLIEFLIRESKK
ncbi:cytosol aminopeptidase-like [Chironomus tepperi]|uniref:cytosol aminopeptidase-like n=1 Tax=Chironomus tepperi TaxID=113505 RepID=UPI00391F014F